MTVDRSPQRIDLVRAMSTPARTTARALRLSLALTRSDSRLRRRRSSAPLVIARVPARPLERERRRADQLLDSTVAVGTFRERCVRKLLHDLMDFLAGFAKIFVKRHDAEISMQTVA